MENSKRLIIFGGINGAGKSTLYHALGDGFFGERLNSDEIIAANGWDWRDVTAQISAGKELLNREARLFNSGAVFNRETTLSGRTILNTIKKAKDLGYTVEMYYVGVSTPEIAIKRVKERELKGGHGVSEETVERRFSNSRLNLKEIFPLCDIVHIFENTYTLYEACWYENGKIYSYARGFNWKNDENLLWVKELIANIYPRIIR